MSAGGVVEAAPTLAPDVREIETSESFRACGRRDVGGLYLPLSNEVFGIALAMRYIQIGKSVRTHAVKRTRRIFRELRYTSTVLTTKVQRTINKLLSSSIEV